MSDLQFILIALGVVIILCVLLYNWWQERKFRLEIASSFIEPKQDALIDNFEINTDVFEETELIHSLKPYIDKSIHAQEDEEKQLANPDFNHLVFDKEQVAVSESNKVNNQLMYVDTNLVDDLQYKVLEEALTDAELDELDTQTPNITNKHESVVAQDSPANSIEQIFLPSSVSDQSIIAESAPAITSQRLPNQVDTKIDLVAVLYLDKALSADQLNYALNETIAFANECDKTVQILGLNAQSTWDVMQVGTSLNNTYAQLLCSLQLANRDGAASRVTINRFQHAIEMLGMELGTTIKWLNNDDPLGFSKQLDEFCIDVDKIIGFHIVKGESGAFHGTKLRGLAEAQGFNLEDNGVFYYKNAHNQAENKSVSAINAPLFSLLNQNNQPFTAESLRNTVVNGITFQMDIPHVKNCAQAFNQMVVIAKKMQQSLNGLLVDDHQKPLTELQINKISQQLHTISNMMQTYGVAPGTASAMRLFS